MLSVASFLERVFFKGNQVVAEIHTMSKPETPVFVSSPIGTPSLDIFSEDTMTEDGLLNFSAFTLVKAGKVSIETIPILSRHVFGFLGEEQWNQE